MATGEDFVAWLMYNPMKIHQFFKTLPLKRRILAKFFEKYRIQKDEYDKWWWEKGLNLPII